VSNDQVAIVVAGVSGVFCVLFITAVCLLVDGRPHAPRRRSRGQGRATLARLRVPLGRAWSRAGTSGWAATLEPYLYWAYGGGRYLPLRPPAALADAPAPAAGDVPGREPVLPPDTGSAAVAAVAAHPAGDPVTRDLWEPHAGIHAFPADGEVA